jgi:hypothetical protein
MKFGTYTVGNAEKKSVVEYITMKHDDHPDVELTIEDGWRFGEWEITPTDEAELSRLLEHDEDEPFEPTTFSDFEFVELCDGWYRDVDIAGFTSEQYIKLENETDDFRQDALQDLGWYEDEYETLVYGPLSVEKNNA